MPFLPPDQQRQSAEGKTLHTAHEQRNKNNFNEIRQTLSPVNETIHYIYLHGQYLLLLGML